MPPVAERLSVVLDVTRPDLGVGLSWQANHLVQPRAPLSCRACGGLLRVEVSPLGQRFLTHDAARRDCSFTGESIAHRMLKSARNWRADLLASSPYGKRRVAWKAQLAGQHDDDTAARTARYTLRGDPGPGLPRAHLPQLEVAASQVPDSGRVVGLDGLRGLAALYVLVFHCWLLTFHGFPANPGPVWLGWLLYGHLAVVFFFILSGFSLAISPARKGWQLGGKARFARRRAWRILPPYWAALVFSLVIGWAVTPQPHSGPPTGRTVVVYGLMLQDIVRAPLPNGAFWSIAVEAGLYLVFALLLLIRRRAGAAAALAVVTLPVVAIELLHPSVSPVDKLTGLTPQFAPLFAMGVLAAGVVAARERMRRLPWQWLAALAAAPVLLLMALKGSVWTVKHYYWIDLAVGPAIAMLLAAVATRRPAPLVWLLATRPVRSLGTFSYSLYLIHLPIVVVISRKLATPHVAPGLPAFWVTLAVAAPISIVAARSFAALFEIPFQRYRSWAALRAALVNWTGSGHASAAERLVRRTDSRTQSANWPR
jgi:peptidoglycan/LPS O-acetylase OafA/YrhL